jgi:hypothetical protein
MWIPDRLYRNMPWLYAAGGALTLAIFGTDSPSALSSLLLFAAAAITFVWRRKAPLIAPQRRPGQLPRRRPR